MGDRLIGKAAVVIGAGSSGPGWGNGKATAVLFAREGAAVVCADINQAAAEETADLIAQEGGQAIALQADATSNADIARIVALADERFGRIDILDNNVGIAVLGGAEDLAESEWDRAFNVNLKSCFLAMKHVIPIMRRQGGGAIVNISSIAGLRYTGVPYIAYAASKAALNHLTRVSAAEHAASGIRVNAVLPGLMKTPMVANAAVGRAYGEDEETMWRARDAQVPMGHQGDAWDVAEAVLFLASDAARYITGVELVVDGGLTLKCN
jgi:NAD(P)-dependent dehydrogenase (short-subunit alcohol dehydrogenase family)